MDFKTHCWTLNPSLAEKYCNAVYRLVELVKVLQKNPDRGALETKLQSFNREVAQITSQYQGPLAQVAKMSLMEIKDLDITF
jgi:hypothetical protein